VGSPGTGKTHLAIALALAGCRQGRKVRFWMAANLAAEPLAAQALFTFCFELYERVSLILTTNLKFADWTQVFGDERLTAALLDRLTHHAHILELVGESFRFRQRMNKMPTT